METPEIENEEHRETNELYQLLLKESQAPAREEQSPPQAPKSVESEDSEDEEGEHYG